MSNRTQFDRLVHQSKWSTVDVSIAVFSIGFFLAAVAPNGTWLFDVMRKVTILSFLLFIPGFLFLRLTSIENEPTGVGCIYAAAMSLGLLSLFGIVASFIGPLLGIQSPFTSPFMAVLILFWVFCCLFLQPAFGSNLFQSDAIRTSWNAACRTNIALLGLFFILPVLAALAAYLMNHYEINTIMIVLIALLIFTFFISMMVYDSIPDSFFIFTTGVSVLFHRILITGYPIGIDMQISYRTAIEIASNGIWVHEIGYHNTLTTITLVPAVLSTLSGVSISTVYNVVYVILFSLVPVGIYYLFRPQTGRNSAIYASLFFIFYFQYFHESPDKQRISMLFLICILLYVYRWRTHKNSWDWFVVLLFSLFMVQSHWGVSLLFLLSCISAYTLRILNSHVNLTDLPRPFHTKWHYITLLSILFFSWYFLTGEGSIFEHLSSTPAFLVDETKILFNQSTDVGRTGASEVSAPASTLRMIHIRLYLIFTGLIYIGLISEVANHVFSRHTWIDSELLLLSIPFAGLLGSSFFYSGGFGIDRMYQLVSILLAVFLPLGINAIHDLINYIAGIMTNVRFSHAWVSGFLCIALSVFLLFNTGVVFHVTGEDRASDISFNPEVNSNAYTSADREGASWLVTYGENRPVYSDPLSMGVFFNYYSIPEHYYSIHDIEYETFDQDAYVYSRGEYISGGERRQPEDQIEEGEVHQVYTSKEVTVYWRPNGSVETF